MGKEALPLQSLAEKPSVTDTQLEILRLLGKGNSRKTIGERLLISERQLREELRVVYNELGVDGQTAAVIQALAKGLLEIHGVVDKEGVDWSAVYDLKPIDIRILETSLTSKTEHFTDKEIDALAIGASERQTPRDFFNDRMSKIRMTLGVSGTGISGTTEAVVMYYAFEQLVKRRELEDYEDYIKKESSEPSLRKEELRVLKPFSVWRNYGRSLDLSAGALALKMHRSKLEKILTNICRKLGVNDIDQAIRKATEVGIL